MSEMMKIRKFGKLISPDRKFDYELNARRIVLNRVSKFKI